MIGVVKMKEWFYDKIQEKASSYNIYLDHLDDDEGHRAKVEEGYVAIMIEEFLGESEKATHLKLASGLIVGSSKGWDTWIPKSVISALEIAE